MALALSQQSELRFYVNSEDASQLQPYFKQMNEKQINYQLFVQSNRELPKLDLDCVWIFTMESIKRALEESLRNLPSQKD